MNFLFKTVIVHSYVSLPEGIPSFNIAMENMAIQTINHLSKWVIVHGDFFKFPEVTIS